MGLQSSFFSVQRGGHREGQICFFFFCVDTHKQTERQTDRQRWRGDRLVRGSCQGKVTRPTLSTLRRSAGRIRVSSQQGEK